MYLLVGVERFLICFADKSQGVMRIKVKLTKMLIYFYVPTYMVGEFLIDNLEDININSKIVMNTLLAKSDVAWVIKKHKKLDANVIFEEY